MLATNITYSFNPTNFTLVTNVTVGYAKLDTVLGVYSGGNVSKLTQIAANDDMFPLPPQSETGQNIFNVGVSNVPVLIQPILAAYYQPYWGPSKIMFNAKGGTTYYFAVDTKYSSYYSSYFSSFFYYYTVPQLYGPVTLNWAYHSSGVFRFASENIDQTGVLDTNGNPMLLYPTAETETSRRWQGTVNAGQYNSTLRTYYTYNAPGVLVTVTRAAGSSGRAMVSYTTVDGNTNLLVNGDAPAIAGVDYTPVGGTLIFNDFEMSKTILIPIIDAVGSFRLKRIVISRWS